MTAHTDTVSSAEQNEDGIPHGKLEDVAEGKRATAIDVQEGASRIDDGQDAPANSQRGDGKASRPGSAGGMGRAATMIQKNYRGYRARRQMKGMGMDAPTRWDEAIKELRYRKNTQPVSPRPADPHATAMSRWRRAAEIARYAGGDDISETSGEEGMDEATLQDYRKQKREARHELEKTAKMMDLQYWLEMVDRKHRYGSNLRAYHNEWKKADTHDNFFHWLDHGPGKHMDLPTVSRERLDSERVRYLSREERRRYLVRIDSEGRLCWAKNGERISTNAEFMDSNDGEGIVRNDALMAQLNAGRPPSRQQPNGRAPASSPSLSSLASSGDGEDHANAEHYVNHDLRRARGLRKLQQVSPATILNQLLQKTVKPGTWIFVADTSFRIYVGIKQSGAFQHSSFLHGARISAAGLIKIKDGQLRKLSPLSGHYRPPTRNFRLFVHALRDAGADMSRVSISRSYAVLVGLEMYVRTRRRVKRGVARTHEKKEKVVHPEQARRREEEKMDQSESAKREREVLEQERTREEQERKEMGLGGRLLQKLHIRSGSGGNHARKEGDITKTIAGGAEHIDSNGVKVAPGQDAESSIPPEGKR